MFKIRASSAGKLMTEPRTKAEREKGGLSQTAKSYIELWVKERLYGRKKEISSKYTDKGNACEYDSIALIEEYCGYFGLELCGESRENEHMKGTCDVIVPDCIIDIKNSWDFDTFPLFETAIDKAYYGQGQVYMHLYGKDKYKLIYTLNDLPEHMVESEFNKFCHREGCERTEEVYKFVKDQHTYSHLPLHLRIKVFEFSYEPEYIEKLISRVEAARQYIKSLPYA